MNPKPVKVCTDCIHILPGVNPRLDAKCDLTAAVSPVDGATYYAFCDGERISTSPGHCGPDGLNWQKKEDADEVDHKT